MHRFNIRQIGSVPPRHYIPFFIYACIAYYIVNSCFFIYKSIENGAGIKGI